MSGPGRAAMMRAAAMAEKVATYRHPKLSAVRLVGELNKKPTALRSTSYWSGSRRS
jgi:hypothetical protein